MTRPIHIKILLPLALLLLLPTAASAQLDKNALDYMLQRPAVAKHYTGKRLFDRLFTEAGIGMTTIVGNDEGLTLSQPGVAVQAAIGDHITPLHGWRVGIDAGWYNFEGNRSKVAGISLDYMLNLTAVGAKTYSMPRPVEVYGVAGADYKYSHLNDESTHTAGLHVGLRAQVRTSPYTYFYVEPRLGLYSDRLLHEESWRNYRSAAQLYAGFGYRLNGSRATDAVPYSKDGTFLNGTFFSVAAGPAVITNSAFSTWKDYSGVRGMFSIGKWFNPRSALRLSFNGATHQQPDHDRLKTLGIGADYMLNLHNAFGGYDPARRFWINGLAGASIDISNASENKRTTTLGLAAALQANVRINNDMDFFVEPRIDVHQDDYAPFSHTAGHWDVTASVMAGLAFNHTLQATTPRQRNADFANNTPYDHFFIEGALGAQMPLSSSTMSSLGSYLRPKVYAAVGKWFTATQGLRLWSEAGQIGSSDSHNNMMGAGADYLWNITNTLGGYREERRGELIGAIGAGLNLRSDSHKLHPGLTLGVKGLLHVNKLYALFIEPQLRLYGNGFVPNEVSSFGKDITGAIVAGVQITPSGYQPGAYADLFNDEGNAKAFISMAGGLSASGHGLRSLGSYSSSWRASYGRWYSPISAWRVNVGLTHRRTDHRHYGKCTVGADYMLDLNTLTYGYRDDRVVSLRALAGANLGIGYYKEEAYFMPDVHAGLQLAFRVSPQVEIYAEPQVALQGKGNEESRFAHVAAQALAGVSYRFGKRERSTHGTPQNDLRRYVSIATGTGFTTETATWINPFRKKFGFNLDATYGQWFDAYKGFRVGLSDDMFRVFRNDVKHVTALHLDYVADVVAIARGESTEGNLYTLNAFAGLSLNMGNRPGRTTTWAAGAQAGLQVGRRIGSNYELFAEPSVRLLTKSIGGAGNTHAVEGQIKVLVGCKYNF